MKRGYLSQYFKGIAVKVLSRVEADISGSNQHEFNGFAGLRRIFGTIRRKYNTSFIYLSDNDPDPVVDKGILTWYDARKNHPTRTEYRMYFPTTTVSVCASAGDLLFIGLQPDDTVMVVIAENESTIGNQLLWLFGITNIDHPGFSIREELESEQDRIAFISRFILEQMGIEVELYDSSFLEEMLLRFDGQFPSTLVFSEYARSTLKDISPMDNPDDVLMAWMEREEILFRTLEKYLLNERLNKGFINDVEGFLKFSISVQNRRKSRVGQALENHVEQLFTSRRISYSRTKATEGKSKPDFIFPGISEYHDMTFDVRLLTMLGVKNTCKDRWRQVLSEAKKIRNKHLLTLEAAITENQTNEMKSSNLQLVVPEGLHNSYTLMQQRWLMNMNSFIGIVQARQKMAEEFTDREQ